MSERVMGFSSKGLLAKYLLSGAVILSASVFSASVSADVIGASAGVAKWNQSIEGSFASADFDKNLNFKEDDGLFLYAAFEHPVPIIPNFKIQKSNVRGKGTVKTGFQLDGNLTTAGAPVTMQFDHLDAIAYKEVLDTVVSVDLGIAVRYYDAEMKVDHNGIGVDPKDSISVAIPMVYGAAGIDLPLTGVYLNAEVMMVSYKGSSINDLKYGVGYRSKVGLGLEAGYRSTAIEMDEVDKFNADMEVGGGFLAVTFDI